MFVSRNFLKLSFQSVIFHARTIITSKYENISYKKETIAEHVFTFCDKYSNNIAFIDDVRKTSYTYSDVKGLVSSIASALTKRGVKQGTMAGIISTNSPEYVMLIYALSSMGCSVTICNQNFTSREIINQLSDSQPSIIFTNKECLSKVTNVISELSTVKNIYLIGDPLPGYETVDKLMADSGNMNPIGQINLDLDSHIALMPYSSGTTGLPKGVMLTHNNLVANFRQINKAHEISDVKKMLIALPLYHIYSQVIIISMGFFSGSQMVFQSKFEPTNYLRAIEQYKISVLHLVPPQILFLLNNHETKNFNLTSIEKCFSAAAPLDAVVENRFIETFRAHQPNFDTFQG